MPIKQPFCSPAVMLGLCLFSVAVLCLVVAPHLWVLPLVLFVVITCLIAPFFPRSGLFMPIIFRGHAGQMTLALTFDDGPDPLTTPRLLQLLAKYNVNATFFVIGRKAEQYPHLIQDILAAGHTLGNHSYHHDVFVMLKSEKRLCQEIVSTQNLLRRWGIKPLIFRPPVGIVNPKLGGVLQKQGMWCVHYSLNARDFGNRRIGQLSRKILSHVKQDDILLLHDVRPLNATIDAWLHEVEQILIGIPQKGLNIVPLADILGRSVMIRLESG